WQPPAGADLISGHGAHHVQEIARVNGRWVVYGLGNFIFNSDGQYGEADVPPLSFLGRLRLADFSGGIEKSLLLYPIVSNNQATHFRPRFVAASEFAELLTRLEVRCPDLRGDDVTT